MIYRRPKIILIPTISFPISKVSIYIPLGLLAIKSYIEDKADVVIVDFSILIKKKQILTDESFYQCAAEYLAKYQADLYAFSTKSGSIIQTITVAENLKRINPGLKVALGGPQATACDEIILNTCNIDFIIRGEGERPFYNIVEAISHGESLSGIKSLSFKTHCNADEERIHDMNTLPIPKYEEYSDYYESYLADKPEYDIQSYIPIDSGRGCPSSCKFCYSPTMWKRKCGLKSAERLFEEIQYLSQQFGVQSFFFTEDNFTISRYRIERLCELMVRNNISVEWNCYSRIDTIDKELIVLMKKAGCRQIYYGVESGSMKILNNLNKNYSMEQAYDIIKFSIDAGINVTASFIVGFPEEDADDISATLNAFLYTIAIGAISKLHMLGVEYGTALYEEVENTMRFCPSISSDVLRDEYLITREMYHKISQDKKLYSYFYTYEQGIFVENWIKLFRIEYNYSVFLHGLYVIQKEEENGRFLFEHLKYMINRNDMVGNSLEDKVIFFMESLIACLQKLNRDDIIKIVEKDYEDWKSGKNIVKRISKTL